jgi:pyridoxal phosphate enzyme (YggS family)
MIKNHYEKVKNTAGKQAELCVVSKNRTPEEIMTYYEAGERIFGENKAVQLKEKAALLPEDIRWQFIGHLQTNKVRMIMPYVSCIQSLDSLKLAAVIEKEAARLNRTADVLAEFHLASEDEEKTGLPAEEAVPFIKACAAFPHLRIRGIMVMGPHTEDRQRIRDVFTQARSLFENLKEICPSMDTLSMGMSDDYEIAVSCGSTMIRVGTYLFEE